MPGEKTRLHLMILTPQARIADLSARDIVLPAWDGLLGVLPGHAPLLCRLGHGLLRYRDGQGIEKTYFIVGGFGHVSENEVIILTDRAITPADISPAEAEEMLLEARALPTDTIEQVEARTAAVQHAKDMLALAKTNE